MDKHIEKKNNCNNCNNYVKLYTIKEQKIALTYYSYCEAGRKRMPDDCTDWAEISQLNKTTNEFISKLLESIKPKNN